MIELRNINKTYYVGDMAVPVLKGISLKIEQGEFVALMGASGSGKSTLMNILGCLDRPTSGEYFFEGREIGMISADERAYLRNHKFGFVFQNFNLLPRTSALDNVIMPLSYSEHTLTDKQAYERAAQMLQNIGLGDRLNYEPAKLSGGQQQRVAIARALINKPSILLADEPTGNLDSHTSEDVLTLFENLHGKHGITIILVTHDPNIAHHAKRIIHITDGVINGQLSSGVNSSGSQWQTGSSSEAKRQNSGDIS